MNKTKISWCDYTWNVTTGCTKTKYEGCRSCYAETIANRFWKDRKFTDVKCHPEKLNEPSKIKKPSLIFVNSMSDLFHKDIPMDFIEKVFNQMIICGRHTFLVLTKRPKQMKNFISYMNNTNPMYDITRFTDNVFFGVSVSTQKDADELIPILLDIPVKYRFVSIEPILEHIDLNKKELLIDKTRFKHTIGEYLDWVIIGAESGAKKRYCENEWIESVVSQCKDANVPVFVKQVHNEYIPFGIVIKKKNFCLEKNIKFFPADIQIQEYPKELK